MFSNKSFGERAPGASIKRLEDKWQLIPDYLRVRGLVRQHIDSFDHFIREEIHKIIKSNRVVKSTVDGKVIISYSKIRVGFPNVGLGYEQVMSTTPIMCRLQDLTYSAPVFVDIMYRKGQVMTPKTNVCIGRVPIMLKSCRCNLRGKSEKELATLKECP